MSKVTLFYTDGSHYTLKGTKVTVAHEDTHIRVTSAFTKTISKSVQMKGNQVVRIPRKELIGYVSKLRIQGAISTQHVAITDRFTSKIWEAA